MRKQSVFLFVAFHVVCVFFFLWRDTDEMKLLVLSLALALAVGSAQQLEPQVPPDARLVQALRSLSPYLSSALLTALNNHTAAVAPRAAAVRPSPEIAPSSASPSLPTSALSAFAAAAAPASNSSADIGGDIAVETVVVHEACSWAFAGACASFWVRYISWLRLARISSDQTQNVSPHAFEAVVWRGHNGHARTLAGVVPRPHEEGRPVLLATH